jgi:S1/P1 Nuclease
VNLPRDADGLEEDPCPLATECVVSAIEQNLAVLSSSSASEQQRLEALKYLGHWVGDVHQPLHVSFEDDRGGNEVGISGGLCNWNLHAVWDRGIIEQALPGPGATTFTSVRSWLWPRQRRDRTATTLRVRSDFPRLS